MGDAAQPDAVIGQHIEIIFQVLAQLGLAGIFQQGFQLFQHLVAIQLIGGTGVVVGQGDVGGLAGLHGEGDADDACLHVAQAGGLRIEGEQLGPLQSFEPGIESLLREYGFVVGVQRFAGGGRAGFRCHAFIQLAQPGVELQFFVPLAQGIPVRFPASQAGGVLFQFHIAADGGELA